MAAFTPLILDLDEDFFDRFHLKPGPVIGTGLSGQVIHATSDNLNFGLAVKMFSMLHQADDMNVQLYTQEVKAMVGVDHPNIIKLISAVRCPRYWSITTPYCRNGTLSQRLSELTPHHLALYLIQLSCAVRYLYKRRIVHADIKPANVFLDDNGHAVLADFGLSFVVPDTTECSANIGGTPAFMAPELLCNGRVDPFKLDVYSLGAVVWCMLFRVEPNPMSVHSYLDELNNCPDVPHIYRCVLTAMLHQEPDLRIDICTLLVKLKEENFAVEMIDAL
ncbi:calcium/calmodulin-dependent protein kinase kinase 2-like [Physella acuta]|uniref:calcium/calmodulin-dependent protein kinase kinase 2-like n=1 Tax=Physella acuta TaxID=109671 RepID=UPI0027DCD00F|nr:calcium/calmodulin-dependent protein kinase kinase 2-like [Physella acuta]